MRLAKLVQGLMGLCCMVHVGCRMQPAPTPPEPPHFDEFPRLVKFISLGQPELVQTVVRDLAGHDSGHPHPEAEERVGGARGFLQVATSAEERLLGLEQLARGCGACHQSAGLSPGPRVAWSHETASEWLVGGLVFGYATGSPPEGAVPDQVAVAWATSASSDTARLEAVLGACVQCHERLGSNP